MSIMSVTTEQYRGGIPLPDLESVKAAIQLFSEGITKNARASEQYNIATGGEVTSMASMLATLIRPNTDSFVGRLCNEVERRVIANGRSVHSFDYDGPGPFFKSRVEVQHLIDGTYLLSLSAAYVNNAPEQGLAEYLGVERGLWWSKVNLTLDAIKGDTFAIDFDPIMERLQGSPLTSYTGSAVAAIIAAGRAEDYSGIIDTPGVITLMGGTQPVTLSIDERRVTSYFRQHFVANGPVLRGEAADDYETGKPMLPMLTIQVNAFPQDADYNGRLPVINTATQAQMLELTTQIKTRFES